MAILTSDKVDYRAKRITRQTLHNDIRINPPGRHKNPKCIHHTTEPQNTWGKKTQKTDEAKKWNRWIQL